MKITITYRSDFTRNLYHNCKSFKLIFRNTFHSANANAEIFKSHRHRNKYGSLAFFKNMAWNLPFFFNFNWIKQNTFTSCRAILSAGAGFDWKLYHFKVNKIVHTAFFYIRTG